MTTGAHGTVREQAIESAKNYLQVILAAEQITDDLTAAVRLWDGDQNLVGPILDTREALCRRLADSAVRLSSAVKKAIVETGGMGSELQTVIAQVEIEQSKLVEKQTECETTLSSELKAVEAELLSMTRHRQLASAYRQLDRVQDARFLDNRL
jgi:hypothetical protein